MSAKKKRLGSRRRLADQSETNTDFGITDTTSVAQCHIPEERTESLNATADLHEAQCETQPPPSPDLLGNRRKLGSSRRSRVQPNPEPTEEVEPSRRGAALQPERQADVLPDCASEAPRATVTKHSEVDLESFSSMSEKETPSEGTSNACSFEEATQEAKKKSDLRHTDEVNVGVGVSEFASVVSCETDQQLIESSSGKEIVEEKLPNVGSVTEKPSDDETEMFTTESINGAENTEIESSLQQGTVSSSKGEMPAEVTQHEHLNSPEVAQARHSEDAVNKVHENEITLMGVREIAYSSESETSQAELIEKNVHDFPNNQSISIPDSKPDEHPEKEQLEDLLLKSDNDHVYDTRKPRSSDIEGDDTVLGQVFEVEDTVHEQDVELAENQEKPQIDFSFEKVTHDATDNSEIIPRNLMNQDGNLRDTYLLSEDMESSFPPEKTREEQSSRERTGPECSGQLDIMSPLKEEVHTNEGQNDNSNSPEVTGDDHSEDAVVKLHEQDVESREDQEKPQIDFSFEKVTHDATDNSEIIPRNLMNQIEVSDTHQSKMAVTNTDDSSISLEESSSSLQTHQSEINVPLDPQLQQTIGHRRKMGSRRKNKGRLHVKDSGAESDQEPSVDVVGNTRDNETQEDTEMALKIEPTENLEKPQIDFSFEKVTHDAKDNSEIIPVNLMNQIEVSDTPQSMMAVTNTDDSLLNLDNSNPDNTQEEHPKEENYFETSDQTNEDCDVCDTRKTQISDIERVDTCQVFEGDTNPSVDQTAFQEKEELLEESSSSLQTHQSEINVPLDPQLQQTIGHRRKMGSRRKNKGRLHVNDSGAESDQEPSVDVVGNTRDNETQEDTGETEVQEKSIETLMKETDQFDTAHTEGVSDQVNGNALDDTPVGIADLTSLGSQSSLTAGHLEIDQSNFRFTPDEEPPNVCSVTEKENNDGDEDTEWLRQDGNLRDTYLLSEDMEPSFPPAKTREEQSSRERTGPECSGQLDIMSPLKEEVHTNEGQNDNSNSPEVTGDDHSEDAVVKLHEQDVESREDQEKPQIDFSFEKVTHDATDNSEIIPRNLMNQIEVSDTHQSKMAVTNTDDSSISLEESSSSLQTHQSEINVPLDPQLQQTIGHRRKMGSRRKNKGRLHVKDSGAESDQEPSVDVVGNTRDNETQEDTEVNSQSNSLVVSSHVKSEDNESSFALEISPEGSPEEPNESECTVGQADLSAKQPVNFPHVTGTSQDSVNQKEHESQEMNVSKEMPKVELFSAPQILATCDVGLKQAETAADVPEQSGTSGPQGMQENNNSDDIVILHGRSTQKRRKMGSTRQSQFNGKRREERAETQEGDTEADTRNRVRAEPVEELTTSATAEWVSQSENANLPLGVVCAEQQETHASSAVDPEEITSSEARPPEQSASIHEEVVDPVEFVHAADVKLHEGSAAVSGEPRNGGTGAASVTPTDEQRVGPVDIEQRRAVISTEAPVVVDLETVTSGGEGEAAEEHVATRAMEPQTDSAEEAAHSANPQVKNASPCLEPKDRRRKMGSTRKNLRTGTKQEKSHQTQSETDKVTETAADVADVKTESFPSAIKDERHVDTGDKDGGPETSEHSRASESHKAPAHQMSEEKLVSQGRMLVTEHRVTPSYVPVEPSTPPKDGSMSESAFLGRRRKMGSNRKSQGHQSHENQTARVDQRKDTENKSDVRSVREENAIHTEELREESSTTKVDQRHGKQLSNLSSSKGEDRHARPVSEKTPEPVTAAQHNAAGIQSHRSPQRFSLDDRPDLRSKAYNVMMIGDSSVGKSSFMKRAQSGKFSLDLPASVGLDSCMWTVLVEGKPVVLQLWDTAGQERFHSLTKQTFHKAHAFLLMYDITCSQSFSSVSYWESCIREAAAESVTILLVGNKSDGAERQVKTQEAEILATEYRFEFMECSAATGENVVQCLETMARMLSEKDETREVNMVLHKEPPKKTSRCC